MSDEVKEHLEMLIKHRPLDEHLRLQVEALIAKALAEQQLNGWGEYRKLVLKTLDEAKEEREKMKARMRDLAEEHQKFKVEILKAAAKAAGAVAGVITPLLFIIAKLMGY